MAAAVSYRVIAILVVLPNILMVWGKVSKGLPPECREFFYLEAAPKGLEHPSLVFICQHYNKKARFVTLYHTTLHTPIYSAYTFKRSAGDLCADVPWMYEPQVPDLKLQVRSGEVTLLTQSAEPVDAEPVDVPELFKPGATDEMQPVLHGEQGTEPYEQPGLNDYMNAPLYERATLNPDVHQEDEDDKASTYTLTNVVPLMLDFLDPVWTTQEQVIRIRLNNYCRGPAYIVTGISTSGRTMHSENMERVAVPSYLWSAYCCPFYDHNAPVSVRYKFPAFAHYGLNAEDDNEVVEVSVQKLQDFLKNTMFEQSIKIFVDDCTLPRDT